MLQDLPCTTQYQPTSKFERQMCTLNKRVLSRNMRRPSKRGDAKAAHRVTVVEAARWVNYSTHMTRGDGEHGAERNITLRGEFIFLNALVKLSAKPLKTLAIVVACVLYCVYDQFNCRCAKFT